MRRLLYIFVSAAVMMLCLQPVMSDRGGSIRDGHEMYEVDIYGISIDSVAAGLHNDRPLRSFSMAQDLYDTALVSKSDYALFKAHSAFAAVYQERYDSIETVYHLGKAIEYGLKCRPVPPLTDYYLDIYRYTFHKETYKQEDEELLFKALDDARNRRDSLRSLLYLAVHNGCLDEEENFYEYFNRAQEIKTQQLVAVLADVYYRAASYPYIFSGQLDSAIAIRRNISDAMERVSAVYFVARFTPPYRLRTAVEYCDSIDSLKWISLQKFDRITLNEFAGAIRQSELLRDEAEQRTALQKERMKAGQELLASQDLEKIHQQKLLDNARLEHRRQETDDRLALAKAELHERHIVLRNQREQFSQQQLDIDRFENHAKTTYLFFLALLLGSLFVAAIIWNRRSHRVVSRLSSLRAEQERLMDIAVEASRRKDDFIRSMSYDVREPLNNVAGFAQLLAQPKEMLSDEERGHFGQLILGNAMKLTEYVDSILSSPRTAAVEPPSATREERENALRKHLKSLHLLKMLLPLALISTAPLFFSHPAAAPLAPSAADSVTNCIRQYIREGQTLAALRLARSLKREAREKNDNDLYCKAHLAYADIFTSRRSHYNVAPNLRLALEANLKREVPENPVQMYCGILDNAMQYIRHGSEEYIRRLYEALAYADNPQLKRKVYVRLAVGYAYRNERDSFYRYYRLSEKLRHIPVLPDDTCHLFADYATGARLYTLIDGLHYYFSGDFGAAETLLRSGVSEEERLHLLSLLYRLSGDYRRSLSCRDALASFENYYFRQRDTLDNLYIDMVADNDSMQQAIMRNTMQLNDVVLMRQRAAIERHKLTAETRRQEMERIKLQMSVSKRQQHVRMRNNEIQRSRLLLRQQQLLLRNKQLLMERGEARFTINVMLLSLALLMTGGLAALATQFLRRRNIRTMMAMMRSMHTARVESVRATEMKDRFIQNMSHEIRTPLNAISGFSQLLSLPADSFSEAERHEFSTHIRHNIVLLQMLIDDIINIGDIEKGRYKFNKTVCHANELARLAMSVVRYRVPSGVSFVFTSSLPDSREICTDSNRVQQVLINYLTNAAKHTTAGHIEVSVSGTKIGGREAVRYQVSDTGSGIPKGEAEHIFGRFVKLDDFVQGTGLGLNICRTISTNLEGRVFVDTSYPESESGVEHGARFVFIVPAS